MPALAMLAAAVLTAPNPQGPPGRDFDYADEGTTLEGYLALPRQRGVRPAVIIVHDWNGLDDYERRRARELSALGYVAFAADVYGKGVRPTTPEGNATEAGRYKGDPALFRRRLLAAYRTVAGMGAVRKDRIAVIGYCFGGTGALELARAGASLAAVATFHGGIGPISPEPPRYRVGRAMIFHAALDPYVPAAEVAKFQEEAFEQKLDYQMEVFNLKTHAFTVPGPMYDATADARSWAELRRFLAETLR